MELNSVLPAGQVVANRYVVEDELLSCRFSTLYRAQDRVSGQRRVLRRLNEPLATHSSTATSFVREPRLQTLREGRTLARLRHRNLPQVLDVLEEGSYLYLVVDEFAGTSLHGLVRGAGAPLDAELVRRLLEQFLAALEYLHGQEPPIIHRDLRPETVIVSPYGTIKIAEFGLAKMNESAASGGTAFRSEGSPIYAAPEQLLGEPSDPRNDIYAAGAILYYLATATEPPPALDRAMREDRLVPLAQARPDLPTDLAGAIMAMLEVDGEIRPASATAARARLG